MKVLFSLLKDLLVNIFDIARTKKVLSFYSNLCVHNRITKNKENSFLNHSFIRRLISFGHPMGHHNEHIFSALIKGNPGLGLIYYTFAKILKPKKVVCIGAFRGFSFLSFAVALRENKCGHLFFIDPSYVDNFWENSSEVTSHLREFGVDKVVTHLKLSSQELVKNHKIFSGNDKFIDILYIDGNHDFEHVKYDFEIIGSFVKKGGFIFLHDATIVGEGFTKWEVKKYIKTIDLKKYEILHIPIGAGLAIVRKL